MNEDPIDRQQLEDAIAAQETLRGLVPDAIVDAAVAALRHQLNESTAPVQRRRQVTVLFADVSGFTAMSSRLDAEVVAERMNAMWERLDAVVVEHGGQVDKHIGDALMAVWGMSSTAEDDPERAVRAALALQEALAQHVPNGILAMRVGINTGPAHLGLVGASTEFTAMGDTVNVASRVESLAPPGGVVVTHETYRHIRGVFDVEELPPSSVKGKADPVRPYVVRRAKERAFRSPTRGVEGIETRMIGRSAELGSLQSEFELVVREPATRRVTVIGDAGVGKSRLLYEFENWIELHPATAYFFKGRALATHRAVAFGLARDLLARRFGVLDSDSASDVTSKLRIGLGAVLADVEADIVALWLGFDVRPTEAAGRLLGEGRLAPTARAHLYRYLETLSVDAPVVIFLEDLHWADDESLALLDDFCDQSTGGHLLVVGVGRPSLLERPDVVGLLERSSVAVRLDALEPSATRMLVDEVLQKAAPVPDALADVIVARADGNAFYVEELVKMLIEDDVIEAGESWERWRIHLDRFEPNRVPSSLTGVLQARLDALDAADRDALQRAAVVGRVFWDGSVDALGPRDARTTERSLLVACQRELVFRRDTSSLDDSVEFTFKHALLRDVTYETVLIRDRQRLHALVARWISEKAGERLTEFAGLIALHHRLAGDLGSAAELLAQSAIASLDAGNSAAARRGLEEAFQLWASTGQARPVGWSTAMAEACLRQGDVGAAVPCADEAIERAITTDERVAALEVGSWVATEQGDLDRAAAMLEEALRGAERQGDAMLAKVLAGLGWVEAEQGRLDGAAAHAERAYSIASDLRHPRETARAANLLGQVAGMRGDLAMSSRYAQEALSVVMEGGDLEGQAMAHDNLGVVFHLLGDASGSRDEYHAAIHHYRQGAALSRRLGRHLRAACAEANIGQAYLRLGDDAAACRLIHQALTGIRQSGSTTMLLFCVLAAADRGLTNGDRDVALELIGVVQRHPAFKDSDRAEIERILTRSSVSAAEVARGMSRGAGLDFDEVVQRLIDELDVGAEGLEPPTNAL